MKWFKHYSDASRGDLLSKINREFGLQGEARWWRLIELMAERYPVENDTFTFTSELLRRSMSFRSLIDLESFLDRLQIHSGLIVNRLGNDYELIYSKLSEIKDNHTKNLQATGKKVSLDKNKIRIDKNIKNNKKENPLADKPAINILNLLNEKRLELLPSSKGFQPTQPNLKEIKARLKENYTLEDFKHVIEVKAQDNFFAENNYKFFNPQTLFRASNFSKYLAEQNPLVEKLQNEKKLADVEEKLLQVLNTPYYVE